MARSGYLSLGERMSVALSRLLHGIQHSPPYQWLRRHGFRGRAFVISVPYLWLLLFFVVPFIIVLKISFADTRLGIPPYTPLLEWGEAQVVAIKLHFENFTFLLSDPLYTNAYLNSLKLAAISTILCLLVGFP